VLKPATSRKPLGWLPSQEPTIAGLNQRLSNFASATLTASAASIQVSLQHLLHLLIGAVVVATLLGSLDYFDGHASHAGEYFASSCSARPA